MDNKTLKLVIRGEITTQTALHIGSGRSLDPIETDNPVIKDHEGKPFIPGSSLKGVFRSIIESTLNSMDVYTCSPSDNMYCVDDEELKNIKKQEERINYIQEKSCPVCKLFGSPFLASRIEFNDAHILTQWNEAKYTVRDGVTIDRESRTAAHGKKFDFETVPPDEKFQFTVTIDKPQEHDFALLMLAINLINTGAFGIGGNTSRGLGKIKIEIKEISYISPKSINNFLSGSSDTLYQKSDFNSLYQSSIKALQSKISEWKHRRNKNV